MNWTLVTGGSKGLGRAICLTLASRGMPVLIHYRASQEEAELVAKECLNRGGQAICLQGDFSNLASTAAFCEKLHAFSSITNIVNNVGQYFKPSALDTTMQTWEMIFQTNLHAPLAIIQTTLPTVKHNRGAIINIGTAGASSFQAEVHATAYTISKKALYALTRSLAKELISDGVRVNMISPGFLEETVEMPKQLDALLQKRVASLQEFADIVVEMLGSTTSYITGQHIEVAGGVKL